MPSHHTFDAATAGGGDGERPRPKSLVHRLALGLVWIAVASGAVVFAEPAPVDVLTIGLIGLLPILGLVRITRGLVVFSGLWLIAGAAAFLATIATPDLFFVRALTHTGISIYLYLAMFVLAGFVARDPAANTRLILGAYLWAGVITSIAGLVGYFGVTPLAEEIFTKFSRASGTFKDPNVFGAFLVPAAVWGLHLVITQNLRRAALAAVQLAVVMLAILLSFSRGAWINLAIAVGLYAYLTLVLAPSNRQRFRLVGMAAVVTGVVIFAGAFALQSPEVEKLFNERASLSQGYDEGPEGRFGGQEKAKRLIADNPMGIGPLVFTEIYHVEDVHNVYLSMFLNAGWIGGFLYSILVLITCVYGFNHALRHSATRPVFFVAYAAFIGQVVEGVVIDTDHWRHFYLLMALVWGMMVVERSRQAVAQNKRPARIVSRPMSWNTMPGVVTWNGNLLPLRRTRRARIVRAEIVHGIQRRPNGRIVRRTSGRPPTIVTRRVRRPTIRGIARQRLN